VLEGGRRRMTRVVGDIRQPRRMETCGAEEPYEGNLHVRFCGGSGRVIADPTRTADCLQPPLRCVATRERDGRTPSKLTRTRREVPGNRTLWHPGAPTQTCYGVIQGAELWG